MAKDSQTPAPSPGLVDKPVPARVTPSEVIATALSLLWLLASGLFFLLMPDGAQGFDGLRFVMVLLAIFLPVAMIWVAALAARSIRVMREESARLQAVIDGMRQTYIKQQQAAGMAVKPAVEKKLDEIAETTRQTETALATFTSARDQSGTLKTQRADAVPDDQPLLALGTPSEALAPPLSTDDFIRALHFPENAEDLEGFAALRRALKDRQAAQLIQAAQDILTLLSQEGIYMDDLRYDRAKPDLWRRFAKGERGRGIAALGGVHDRSSLALAASRMREDPIFRDAAHHFLRLFDKTLLAFEESATDAELARVSTTRTAVAFMLLGRVAGMFG